MDYPDIGAVEDEYDYEERGLCCPVDPLDSINERWGRMVAHAKSAALISLEGDGLGKDLTKGVGAEGMVVSRIFVSGSNPC